MKMTPERIEQLDDIREVMSTKPGRRFVWRLLSEGNIFRRTYTGNSETFYLEGKREFMLPFYQDIMNVCPELFFLAQKENFKTEEVTNDRTQRTRRGR